MMFPSSESKRSNRKAKKKRTLQTKENQSPTNTVTEEKIETMIKPSLDTSVSLSQVVNKASFTPFLDGERCILCHQERPVITRKGGSKGDIMPGSQQLVDKLPLWVCPDCRKKLEEDEQRAGMDTALVNNDMLFQSTLNVGHSFLPEEVPEKDVCNCHVCAGKRYLVPGKTKELQELQFSWFEVKHFVRCVYREAGTTLADDDKLMSGSLDMDRIKRHTERLTLKDPHQLYERLEAQTKEYLAEVRIGLIKFLSSTFSNSPQHAKDCVMTLLDEYQSLCVASDILKPFLANLESSYLGQFQLTWELINKKLFCHEIFHDPIIQSSLPTLLSQLRSCTSSCGVPIPDKCIQDSQSYLIDRFDDFSQEMSATNTLWQKVKLEKNKKENCMNEQNLHERGKNQSENWDYPIENEKDDEGNEFCVCAHCVMSTASFSSGSELNEMSSSLMSPKRSCLSSSSSSSGSNTTYCSRHTNNASTDNDLGNLSSTQLLPTALFLNRLTNSNCASCIREALHSFCFDQKNASTKCRHHDAQDKASSLSPLSSCEPYEMPPCHSCENHESHEVRCPFQHNSLSPPSPETASSIQSLLLNGSSAVGKCRTPNCTNPVSCAAKQTEWDEDDECCTDEGCEGHEHRGALSPSISIPGNNVNLEAPPSSPSSVRSNGDGSSCDTPTSRSSLSEDGRSNNGKYCDCCYCEFFGHGAPPVAQTSHNFVEMREKLRLRLKVKEKEKKPMDFSHHPQGLNCLTDSRSVDELLTFINGNAEGQTAEINEVKTSSKAAKRQRQKMKKAAEKENHVIEADEKGYCLLRPRRNETEERRAFCEEKTRKSLKQKKSAKTQGNCLETQRQNAKNSDKTLNRCVRNDAIAHLVTANHQSTRNDFDEKPKNAPVKQGNGSEGAGHVDRRKKKKDKQCAANESRRGSANGQERRVFVNGSGQEVGRYVEHTRGARLPVREEAEPRHCGEECPPTKELQTQGKKSKGRKKKKGAFLDDVFLPKENTTNGHSGDVDEAEREVEEFKRFCASVGPVGRKMKLPANVNLKNLNIGMKKS